MQEDKENLRLFSNTKNTPLKPKRKYFTTPEKLIRDVCNDSTLIHAKSNWHKQSDDTFETIERMCNKTLSDPENSIHDYLANWDEKHSQDSKSEEEVLTLNKLFEEIGFNDRENKIVNQTQLSDVEPPSCLWDNTVNNESCLPASPIKTVGQLRPSTIIEESSSDSLGSSSNSFNTARLLPETASSDQYETANDTQSKSTNVGNRANTSKLSSSNSTDSGRSTTSKPDAAVYFEMFPLRKITYEESTHEPKVYKPLFLQRSKKQKRQDVSMNSSDDTSRGFSSLSMDSLEMPRRRRSKSSKYFDDSLELSRTSEGPLQSKSNFEKKERRSSTNSEFSQANESSVILVSDEEDETTSSDDLNKGFVRGMETPTDESVITSDGSDLNVSREFNNTLEEIEYIMKQGQKYLEQNKSSPPKPIATPNQQIIKHSAASYLTPRLHKSPLSVASPTTPCTVIRRPKLNSATKSISPLHAKAMLKNKPMQRVDDRFHHIMSPIRAYIHNTPKSPITAKMKATEDIFESKFSRDSRVVSRKAESNKQTPSNVLHNLPRKAYVSADYRHIVDERSPISIPGGNKIHQYLEIGMAPAVLKHEGKFKTTLTHAQQKCDLDKSKGSLADFSLASGDMSVLLLKDAKKLASKY